MKKRQSIQTGLLTKVTVLDGWFGGNEIGIGYIIIDGEHNHHLPMMVDKNGNELPSGNYCLAQDVESHLVVMPFNIQ